MNQILLLFITVPFLGFLASLLLPETKEKSISNLAFGTLFIQLIALLIFVVAWLFGSQTELNVNEITLLKTENFEFFIDFYFDKISAVYMVVGTLLSLMITTYSRYYLHREQGYKRFFNTILFFYFGYSVAILAGNFETLFIGWEIIGMTSFLLIAFYRNRYIPVKNAFKVFSIYRIGDVGMILAMWASHHLFHENITFLKMHNAHLVSEHFAEHSLIGVFIALCLACAAAAKSAQIPFSTWLPRAMEGPTPSSAIFYGALSVHLGVFLMLRTFPFWENQASVRVAIGLMGLTTSVIASLMARVQSSIKSQIAYSSVAQIGVMFIETSFGLTNLVLFHFVGNAFLRSYQLLVSPSVVSYKIREQFYHFIPNTKTIEDKLPKKWARTLFLLSLKEFNLENVLNYIIWKPLKLGYKTLTILSNKQFSVFSTLIFIFGLLLFMFKEQVPAQVLYYLPILFALASLLFVVKSFRERTDVLFAWVLLVTHHFWIVLSILFNEKLTYTEILFYVLGAIFAGIVGFIVLYKLQKTEKNHSLNTYLGHVYEHKTKAFLFLLTVLAVTGFPITTTFIGEDLMFSHINENQVLLALPIALSFIVSGLAGIRIYIRIFLGPHVKTYHTLPYKSA